MKGEAEEILRLIGAAYDRSDATGIVDKEDIPFCLIEKALNPDQDLELGTAVLGALYGATLLTLEFPEVAQAFVGGMRSQAETGSMLSQIKEIALAAGATARDRNRSR